MWGFTWLTLLLSYISSQASKEDLPYPGWALAVLVTLIVVAFLPVPIGYLHSLLLDRLGQSPADTEARYEPCATTDTDLTPLDTLHPLLEENHHSHSPNGHIESVQSSVLWESEREETTVYKHLRRIYFNQDLFIRTLLLATIIFMCTCIQMGTKITDFKGLAHPKKLHVHASFLASCASCSKTDYIQMHMTCIIFSLLKPYTSYCMWKSSRFKHATYEYVVYVHPE